MIKNFIEAIQNKPEFWKRIKEENIKDTEKFFCVILFISFILILFSYFVFPKQIPLGTQHLSTLLSSNFKLSPGILTTLLVLSSRILQFASAFIAAGLFHIFLRTKKESIRYTDTLKVYIYSTASYHLLSFIPFIGTILSLYSLILMVNGLSTVHEISQKEIWKAYVSLIAIAFLIIMILRWNTVAQEKKRQQAYFDNTVNQFEESMKDKIDPSTNKYLYENSFEVFSLEYPTTWKRPFPTVPYFESNDCQIEEKNIPADRLSTGFVSESAINLGGRPFVSKDYFDVDKSYIKSYADTQTHKSQIKIIFDFPQSGNAFVLMPKYPATTFSQECLTDYQNILTSIKFLK